MDLVVRMRLRMFFLLIEVELVELLLNFLLYRQQFDRIDCDKLILMELMVELELLLRMQLFDRIGCDKLLQQRVMVHSILHNNHRMLRWSCLQFLEQYPFL